MKKLLLIWTIAFIVLISSAYAAIWVDDHNDCPSVHQSISCTGIELVCGYIDPTVYCEDPAVVNGTIPASNSTTDSGLSSGSFDGGFVYDCTQSSANCNTWTCQRDSTCFNVNRRTTCIKDGTDFGCHDCRSGYTACDGAEDDGDGCEVQDGVTACSGGANNNLDSSCVCQCDSGFNDCDGGGAGAGDGCEIQDGAACTAGGVAGTYDGCSGSSGNCVIPVNPFEASSENLYSTLANASFLSGHDFGVGPLVQFNTSDNDTFFVSNDARLGINVTNPIYAITVIGDINVSGFVNASRLDGLIDCSNIDGGSDGDFCADADSGGGGTQSDTADWINNATSYFGAADFNGSLIKDFNTSWITNNQNPPIVFTLGNVSNNTPYANVLDHPDFSNFQLANVSNDTIGVDEFDNGSVVRFNTTVNDGDISTTGTYITQSSSDGFLHEDNSGNDIILTRLNGGKGELLIDDSASADYIKLSAQVDSYIDGELMVGAILTPNDALEVIGSVRIEHSINATAGNFTDLFTVRLNGTDIALYNKSINLDLYNQSISLDNYNQSLLALSQFENDIGAGGGGDTDDLAIVNVSMLDNGTIIRNNSRTANLTNLTIFDQLFLDPAGGGTNEGQLTWLDDPNTGMTWGGADTIYFYAGGTQALIVTANSLRTQDGSAASPVYSFNGDTDTGIFQTGTDILGVSAGGVERGKFTITGLTLAGTLNATSGNFTDALTVQGKDVNHSIDLSLYNQSINHITIEESQITDLVHTTDTDTNIVFTIENVSNATPYDQVQNHPDFSNFGLANVSNNTLKPGDNVTAALWNITGGNITPRNAETNITIGSIFIDPTNTRIGIGDTDPTVPLKILANSDDDGIFIEQNSGGEIFKIRVDGGGDLVFRDNDDTTILELVQNSNQAAIASGSEASPSWTFVGDLDSGLFGAGDTVAIVGGAVEFLTAVETTQDELVVNEDGDDIDFRVEASGITNAFFVEGATGDVQAGGNTVQTVESAWNSNNASNNTLVKGDNVSIAVWNNTADGVTLRDMEVGGVITENNIAYRSRDVDGTARNLIRKNTDDQTELITSAGGDLEIVDGSQTNIFIDGSKGKTVIGTDAPAANETLHVIGNFTVTNSSNQTTLFVETESGSQGRVAVGTRNALGDGFTVNGNIFVHDEDGNGLILFRSAGDVLNTGLIWRGADDLTDFTIQQKEDGGNLILETGSGSGDFTMDLANGFVGIGTETPLKLLSVEGSQALPFLINRTDTDGAVLMEIGNTIHSWKIGMNGLENLILRDATNDNQDVITIEPNSNDTLTINETGSHFRGNVSFMNQSNKTTLFIDTVTGGTGRVGIGTKNTQGNILTVNGNLFIFDEDGNSYLVMQGSGTSGEDYQILFRAADKNNDFFMGPNSDGGNFLIYAASQGLNDFSIDLATGNVGINNEQANNTLDVSGDVNITGTLHGARQFFYAYDNAGGQSIPATAGTWVHIGFDTEVREDSYYTHATTVDNGNISVSHGGDYLITVDIGTDVTAGSTRSDTTCKLELGDGTTNGEVLGTRAHKYDRATNGLSSLSISAIVPMEAGEEIQVSCRCNDGAGCDTIATQARSSRFLMEYIGR
ncbi:MAG: hypothetical protein CL811_06340 [Colwelliaceae bacterium]|jgi:hypothetical protein|nr:hypothetical protein [Colwelliaceae bacterium]|tara:strand:+ start:996 stop:5783 length:4788 start_codon:yes stop_codon:yes gene_type:complete